MLESVLVVADVVIIVIGVGKERVACGEDIAGAEVRSRQLSLLRVFDGEYFLGIVVEVLAQFVAQVGIGVPVADYFHGIVGADASVVRCDNYLVVTLCQNAEHL